MNQSDKGPAIVGIDLGTTHSLIATLSADGEPVVHDWRDQENSKLVPSAVCLEPDHEGVGDIPRRRAAQRETLTYTRFKRTAMASGEHFEGPKGPVTAVDLSARILTRLLENPALEGRKISKAVITVPAMFNNAARSATKAAAALAGLDDVRLVNEPTAAALYYIWQMKGDFNGNLAVFDLGGGTLDVTILHANGLKVEVLATGGLINLGGVDFDDALLGYVRQGYTTESGGSFTAQDYNVIKAEKSKINLSKYQEERIKVRGSKGKKTLQLGQADFEKLIAPLLSDIPPLIEEVIQRSKLTVGDIDQLLAVGGSTRIPAVRRVAAEAFKREPINFGHVDQVVAKGAVVFAAKEAEESWRSPPPGSDPEPGVAVASQPTAVKPPKADEVAGPILDEEVVRTLREMEIVERTSKSFGTDAIDENGEEYHSIIIPVGTQIPCKETKKYRVRSRTIRTLPCKILESSDNDRDMQSTDLVAEIALPLRPDRQPQDVLFVTFGYDKDQVMTCEFQDGEDGDLVTKEILRS